ncbi:hypothetical protein [Cognaticolwellia aestuarii]|uniref:hypothetical protein n=1 Tax=Cognaticolwellia aestuarii TaxID=329993 RepID=UPI000986F484|nr:hypothetical protein [Cognaticolwellia aestuarii]
MKLFSWFINTTKINSAKNDKASLERELLIFNNNTMWPIAKVRNNIVVQQQTYVNAASNLKETTQVNTLKEHTNS